MPATEIKAHADLVYALALSPDDTTLATAGFDGLVKLWDLKGELPGTPITLPDPRAGVAYGLAFGPDGTLAVAEGLLAGWRRGRLGVILGAVAVVASLTELYVLASLR